MSGKNQKLELENTPKQQGSKDLVVPPAPSKASSVNRFAGAGAAPAAARRLSFFPSEDAPQQSNLHALLPSNGKR